MGSCSLGLAEVRCLLAPASSLSSFSCSICWCRDPILYPKTPTSMSTYQRALRTKKQLSILNRKMESIMEMMMMMMMKMEQQSHQVVRKPQKKSQAIRKEKAKQQKNVTGRDVPLLMEKQQRHQKLHQKMSIQSMVTHTEV